MLRHARCKALFPIRRMLLSVQRLCLSLRLPLFIVHFHCSLTIVHSPLSTVHACCPLSTFYTMPNHSSSTSCPFPRPRHQPSFFDLLPPTAAVIRKGTSSTNQLFGGKTNATVDESIRLKKNQFSWAGINSAQKESILTDFVEKWTRKVKKHQRINSGGYIRQHMPAELTAGLSARFAAA